MIGFANFNKHSFTNFIKKKKKNFLFLRLYKNTLYEEISDFKIAICFSNES